MNQGCLNCRWADYLKTPAGRLVRGNSILCRFPVASLEGHVEAFRALLPASMRHLEIVPHPHGMEASDGADCPTWEVAPTPGNG